MVTRAALGEHGQLTWQAGEAGATAEIARGDTTQADTMDELVADLD